MLGFSPVFIKSSALSDVDELNFFNTDLTTLILHQIPRKHNVFEIYYLFQLCKQAI